MQRAPIGSSLADDDFGDDNLDRASLELLQRVQPTTIEQEAIALDLPECRASEHQIAKVRSLRLRTGPQRTAHTMPTFDKVSASLRLLTVGAE